jgi:hypothetical protein
MTIGTTRSGDPMMIGPGAQGGTTTLRLGPEGARVDIRPGSGAIPETVHFPK